MAGTGKEITGTRDTVYAWSVSSIMHCKARRRTACMSLISGAGGLCQAAP
jgi:hypothetical protein